MKSVFLGPIKYFIEVFIVMPFFLLLFITATQTFNSLFIDQLPLMNFSIVLPQIISSFFYIEKLEISFLSEGSAFLKQSNLPKRKDCLSKYHSTKLLVKLIFLPTYVFFCNHNAVFFQNSYS